MSLFEVIVKRSQIQKPFESRVASNELRARVEKFRKILKDKQLNKRSLNVWKQ